MSDIHDLIARNAIMAYNEGLETGSNRERDRLISLIRQTYNRPEVKEFGSFVWTEDIVKLLEGDTDGL